MGQHSLPGNPPVPLQMRTSARARRITLRISSLDGTVTLTRPRGVSERAALDFARDKEAWLRGHLANQEDAVSVGLGVRLPIEGLARRVEAGQGRRVRLDGDRVLVPGPEERVAARLLGFLKDPCPQPAGRSLGPIFRPSRARLCAAHPARHPLALGQLHGGWRADVFLAADPRPARGAGICRRT